ncbi:glycoside hydrolase family 99-like domain-containing protein [Actinocrinis puniceicyclus]|uniref:Glycoside hydrolase family 99-like domain-containing protein n=1 Tax=Actinocrinis puniceicyclus TaxID=977794 RepID=A0A8J8BCT4_9ACTN|nr:glycoside hydrolase family 99-like domain-containing protein [Actinocrinis puniceicyclus]MBS2965452.1 glycoside hydrolase family 99-like domain-containing protein [Actinocrinis puniceicyclus]
MAFFLPQYHPIPENDRWWGAGFTEWTHVAAARPLFDGHVQPRLPADLGFYDLRVLETRRAQWELAARYGVTALCYWHYWFGGGSQLLTRPAADLLAHPKLPHRYCLAWANQSWTGVWHGRGDEVLQRQLYPGESDDVRHFSQLLPHFRDERYLTVEGKPVFYLFRPDDVPDLARLVALWRRLAVEAGLPGLYLIGDADGAWVQDVDQPLDAAVWNPAPPPRGHELESGFPGVALRENPRAFPYDKVYADWLLYGHKTSVRRFPCVVPGFDNTPRSGRRGILLHRPDPDVFEEAVRAAAGLERAQSGPRIMFVKSWNEWAEGSVMEPDQIHGRAFLRALERGLTPVV